MKYELQTIPVWKAIEADPDCLLCFLEDQAEARAVTFFLGNSIMAPEMRVQLNEHGFCTKHFHMLAEGSGKLGYSLALATHIETIEARLAKQAQKLSRATGRAAAKEASALAAEIEERNADCLLCDRVQANMLNFTYTICKLFVDTPEFRQALAASRGVCLQHLPGLLSMGREVVPTRLLPEWHSELLALVGRSLRTNADDLEAFTWQFDYQSEKQTPDHAMDAIPRAVRRLGGYRPGDYSTGMS